jgi:hypothetical protein
VTAVSGDRVTEPVLVGRLKVTVAPGRGAPVESTTRKTMVEVSATPVPFRPMVEGVAVRNCMDPIVPAATVMVPLAVRDFAATVAVPVMTSAALQPLAVYVAFSDPVDDITEFGVVPAVLTPEGVIAARPVPRHCDPNARVTEAPVYRAPV